MFAYSSRAERSRDRRRYQKYRIRSAATAVGLWVTLMVLAPAAMAASLSLSGVVANDTLMPVGPTTTLRGDGVVASGTADGNSAINAYMQIDASTCAPTAQDEFAKTSSVDLGGSAPGFSPGSFSWDIDLTGAQAPPGDDRLCAYLTQYGAGSPDAVADEVIHIEGSAPPTAVSGGSTTGPASTGAPTVIYCTVPRLIGKTLASATKALKAAGCGLGKVRRVHTKKSRRGRVISQSLPPGRILAKGTKVKVTIGRA